MLMARVFLFILIVAVYVLANEESKKLPGIIIIPGIGSSQLNSVSELTNYPLCPLNTNFELWFNIEALISVPNLFCVYDNIGLEWKTGSVTNKTGSQVSVSNPWNLASFEFLDSNPLFQPDSPYFFSFVQSLVSNAGYQRNVNITGAPYDWRLGPLSLDSWFKQLKIQIENQVTSQGSRVVIVGHSMGGILAHHFLASSKYVDLIWKLRNIAGFVSISTPWLGAIEAAQAILSGTNFGTSIVQESLAQVAEITFESVYYLLPSNLFFKPSQVFVETSTRNYTSRQWKQLFSDIGWKNNASQVYDRQIINSVSPVIPPLGVRSFTFYGTNISSTPLLLKYSGDFKSPLTIVGSNGDGTVLQESLTFVDSLWSEKATEYPNFSHSGVLNNPAFQEDFLALLSRLA